MSHTQRFTNLMLTAIFTKTTEKYQSLHKWITIDGFYTLTTRTLHNYKDCPIHSSFKTPNHAQYLHVMNNNQMKQKYILSLFYSTHTNKVQNNECFDS